MTLRVGILTVSDRAAAGTIEDLGGPAIEAALAAVDVMVEQRAVVPDEIDQITDMLRTWADQARLDLVLTTGGTGLGPRDVTPDATRAVCEREIPGIAEAIRGAGLVQTEFAMLSRAIAATRGTTLMVNLPGSPLGAAQATATIAPVLTHAVAIMHGGKH
jgi:molybdenum cofactor synthesis domain-containing protein